MPLPAAERSGLSKHETRTTLHAFSWNLGLRSVFETVGSGTGVFITAFALSLGIAKESMGTIGSIAGLAGIAQLVAIALNNHIRDRKRFTLALAYAEPAIIIAAVVALPLASPAARLPLLMLAVFTAAAFLHMTVPVTEAWLATAVPAGVRERYLGRRFQLRALFAIVTGVIMALIGQTMTDQLGTWGLVSVIAVGCVFGLLAVMPLRAASMPMAHDTRIGWRDIWQTVSDLNFRRFIGMNLAYNAPFFLMAAFYYAFALDVVKMSLMQAALIPVVYQLVRIPTISVVRKLPMRIDRRHILCLIGPLYIVFFGIMAFAREGMIWPVYLGWTCAATGDGAFGVIVTSVSYHTSPAGPRRQTYFAMVNLLTLLAGVTGAKTGELLLISLKGHTLVLLGFEFGQFHILWLIAACIMVLSMFSGYILARPTRHRPPPPGANESAGE